MTDLTLLASPRVPRATFSRDLARRRSPAAAEADSCYDAIASHGVDPAVALAFFVHESGAGTAGRAAGANGFPATKSWGNLRWRAAYAGSLPYPVTDIDGFVGYATFTEAADHFARHLVGGDGTDAYQGRLGAGMTVSQVVPIWAPSGDGNTPTTYIDAVNGFVAALIAQEGKPAMPKPRILLVAGHNNIEGITVDGLADGLDKAATVATLRGSTGSRGEREWTGSYVQLQADALRATGLVDVAVTDSIYHSDVYSQRWDLIILAHYHRDADPERAMFATIDPGLVPGQMTAAARAEAQRFVERVIGGYTAATGIPVTQPLVTLNMTRIYSYGYSTADSPMLVAEFGNANLDAATLYEPGIARIVRYFRDCMLEHLGIVAVPAAPPARRASDVPLPAPAPQPVVSPVRAAATQLRAIADQLDKVA